MTNTPYILDTPLPPEQDFNTLKENGLEFIRTYSAGNWTNLNPSDPGITILDQLCYALTELGYCGDFPVGDLLAAPDGKLYTQNQFWLPEEILTTAPVTINDYRKYIIDAVPGIDNALVLQQPGTPLYQVYLMFNTSVAGTEEQLCRQVFFLLNKSRNLGELFLMPAPLTPVTVTLSGQFFLSAGANPQNALNSIQQQLRNYIFPVVAPVSYEQLKSENCQTDDILDGPVLHNGCITDEALGIKQNSIRLLLLNQLLNEMNELEAAAINALVNYTDGTVNTQPGALIVFDLAASVQNNTLVVYANGSPVAPETFNAPLPDAVFNFYEGTGAHTFSELPGVNWRDAGNYYAVQNTFPEIYAAGADAPSANAPGFEKARSRQLKGYLTLFDQALANQFAQLANIGQLFSFRNAVTGTPHDKHRYYAVKDCSEKKHNTYPVPYKTYSPTYFYQSLYDVPYIRPLLKDNREFYFNDVPLNEQELEQKSWSDYKLDPYNPYIHGLMNIVEDESVNLERRNNLLNHLLSRYGESPLAIDEVINGAAYTGDEAVGKVIIKSLLLQNLALLSYNRAKGYNYIASCPVNPELPGIPEDYDKQFPGDYTFDFIPDSAYIDHVEKITASDFTQYASFELRLSLLLGLQPLYRKFISEYLHLPEYEQQVKQLLWLLQERRGVIFFENALLHYSLPAGTNTSLPANGAMLIFPGFVPYVTTPAFASRRRVLCSNTLPVMVPVTVYNASTSSLAAIIPAYANWVNSLRYNEEGTNDKAALEASATALLNVLNALTETP